MYIPSQYGRLVARHNETIGADSSKEVRNDTAHRNNIFIIVSVSPRELGDLALSAFLFSSYLADKLS
jgi:hypothetical protein